MADKKTVVKEISRKNLREEIPGKVEKENDHISIPVIEERLKINKELVEQSKVRIRKSVTEEEVSENIPTYHENVTINRVEINKYVDSPPEIRSEGLTTIIPVIKEVLVVEKKLMLVEEIHVTRQRDEVAVEVKDKVRKEHVEITKTAPDRSGT